MALDDLHGRLLAQAAEHLADYPEDAHFVAVCGPSGAGKGTAVKQFLELMPEFHVPVSVTTRLPRENEYHGVHYEFITLAEFEELVDAGKIMTGDGYPGSGKFYADYWPDPGEKRILFEITLKAALLVQQLFPTRTTIFFFHPTGLDEDGWREFLTARLKFRNTEDDETILARVDEGMNEIALAAGAPGVIRIYNHETPNSVTTMRDILRSKGVLQEQ